MGCQCIVGPRLDGQITIHQQLAEAEKSQLHGIGVELPALPRADNLLHSGKIVGWLPVFFDFKLGKLDSKIVSQPLLEWQVRESVFVSPPQVECRSPRVAHEFDGKENERCLTG